MTFYCVRVGEKYGVEYVQALRRGVAPHTLIELCPPDDGWWAKMWLFKPGYIKDRHIFFLDLDAIVLNINILAAVFEECRADPDISVAVPRNYLQPRVRIETSVMYIDQESPLAQEIWLKYEKRGKEGTPPPPTKSWADHTFVEWAAKDRLTMLPDWISQSYKVQIQKVKESPKRMPQRLKWTAVLDCHGVPKPLEIVNSPNLPLHKLVKTKWVPDEV